MAKATFAFSNFTAGELSPRLGGRTDLSKYYSGCSLLENFVVHAHGGVSRRPGTRFVAEVKDSSAFTRLVRFQFSVTQAYVLEFGNNYFRVYKDGAQITSGSPAAAVEVATSYTTAQLRDLKFAQSADVMYVVHNSHPVRKISRTSDTAWSIADAVFQRGPFMDANKTDTTLTANGRTGSVTISASAVTGINGGSGFLSTDVGRLVKLHNGYAKITAVGSTTSVTATVMENDLFEEELEPVYAADTISFKEGDPSSTGLEHNDRILDSDKQFVAQGFTKGVTITISGTTSNNKDVMIVQVTEDTLVVTPSDDLADEAADSGHTLWRVFGDDWLPGMRRVLRGAPDVRRDNRATADNVFLGRRIVRGFRQRHKRRQRADLYDWQQRDQRDPLPVKLAVAARRHTGVRVCRSSVRH